LNTVGLDGWTLGSNLSARRLFGDDRRFNAAFIGAEVASFTVSAPPALAVM